MWELNHGWHDDACDDEMVELRLSKSDSMVNWEALTELV